MVRKENLLRELGKGRDLMKGSLAATSRRCGKKGCKCEKGVPHPGHYFSHFFKGKPYVIYVPETLTPKVKILVENWKEEKALIEKLTHLNTALIKKRKL